MFKLSKYNVLESVEIIGLSILIDKKILVVSDLHIDFENYLNRRGFLIPRTQMGKIRKYLGKIIDFAKPETIIINGDMIHTFGKTGRYEKACADELLGFLGKKCRKIIVLRGNHDPSEFFFKNAAVNLNKTDFSLCDEFIHKGILVNHGHKISENSLKKNVKTIIIGHEHPAVYFREKPGEGFKCFLLGKYRSKNLLVMPSFNFITSGSDFMKEKKLSPYLGEGKGRKARQQEFSKFERFIVSDEGELFSFGEKTDF